jgi:hypothetical protein
MRSGARGAWLTLTMSAIIPSPKRSKISREHLRMSAFSDFPPPRQSQRHRPSQSWNRRVVNAGTFSLAAAGSNAQTGPLYRGNMDENVLAAALCTTANPRCRPPCKAHCLLAITKKFDQSELDHRPALASYSPGRHSRETADRRPWFGH